MPWNPDSDILGILEELKWTHSALYIQFYEKVEIGFLFDGLSELGIQFHVLVALKDGSRVNPILNELHINQEQDFPVR